MGLPFLVRAVRLSMEGVDGARPSEEHEEAVAHDDGGDDEGEEDDGFHEESG